MEQPSGENGVVVSSASTGFTVQIIRTSTGTVQQPEPRLFQLYDDEPGVAQTLLNIAQPGTMAVDQGQMGDFVSVDEGEVDDETVVVKEELEAIEDSSYQLIDAYNEKEKEERHEVADDIRSQIAELCNQLCDLGEESFLLSVRLLDGKEQHVGSVKGDHFCLLRPEIVQDFQNFCLGIEEERRPEEDDEMQESLEDTSMQDDDNSAKLENEQHELMDVETMTDKNDVQKAVVMKPKVILLKKSADGQSTEIDHQYITPVKAEPHPAEPASNDRGTTSNKENKETTTSILFLCDICKNVFTDIKQLRQHKFDVHGESDYKCDKCARVFSLKKTYERHMMDAHMEGEEKHLCDSCVLTFHTPEELEHHIYGCHNTDLPMKCDICEQTFPDILRLMEHRKLHFDYACFCDKCWQGFFDYLELEAHNQSGCRYKEALYKCHICGKRFTKLATISKHIDTHPVHSPHVCRMCGRGFDTEKELKYHRSGAHIIRPFKCEFCDKTFKKKDSVIEHRRLHMRVTNMPMRREPIVNANGNVGFVDVLEDDDDFMGKPEFECNTCGIALKTQNMLDQHIHQHETAAEQYKCDCCTKIFFSLNLLNIHCRRDHKMLLDQQGTSHVADLDKIQVCEWEGCNKTFYDDSKLRQHIKYHGQRADKIARGVSMPERSSATCEICGKILKYKSYMKAHMMSHFKDHPYQCELCGQAYPTAKRLEDHVRVHKGEKPFKCRICEKCFTSKSLRNQHMLIHLGHKTYICDVCGKGFMSRKHFKDHMRIHAGEEPHKCETCGKDFIYYRSLVRHMQVHVDPRERNKPYKCEYCNKEYTEVTGYKHHMRAVHTGETPFQCDICGESFHRNDKLKRHIKSRHSIAKGNKEIIVTARRPSHGGPIIVKAENENQEDLLQIVEGSAVDGDHNELHVDVIQNENDGQQQVFLIGLGNDGNEATYLQETQVIEGPDGTRYIIAGSGEELQVIESSNLQQLQDGQIVEGGIIQQVHQVEQVHNAGTNDVLVMNDGDEETLSTLANMASEAQIANQ